MLKYILLLSVLTISILTFAFCNNFLIGNSTFTLAQATPTKSVSIKSVKLDKNKAVLWCPDHEENKAIEGSIGGCLKKDSVINISTELTDNNENLEYHYIVSSGEIIGEGKDVVWKFTNSKIGKHTITVGIGKDGIIIGKTITRTVELIDCPSSCHPSVCECPDIIFNPPPKQVKAGDIFVLSVKSSFPELKVISAKWTIQGGEIINGQGTKKILVRIPENTKNKMLKATVETETDCEYCRAAVAEEIKIVK